MELHELLGKGTMGFELRHDRDYEERVDKQREKLGLPSLNRAKEALERHLVARLSAAEFPIRNQEELRRALGQDDRTERVIALVASRDYLFTSPQQVASLVAQRAAAAWDLSARRRTEVGRDEARDASVLGWMRRRRNRRAQERRVRTRRPSTVQ